MNDDRPLRDREGVIDTERKSGLLLLAIVLIAVAVRGPLLSQSLWLDELHTSWAVHDQLADVADRARQGNNSPLYFVFMWFWQTVVGHTEVTLRLPSFLAGLAIVFCAAKFTYTWTSCRILALLAAFFAAIDPHLAYYSVEARPYAIVQLLGLFEVACLGSLLSEVSIVRRSIRIVLLATLFHLHYTTALLPAAELLFLAGVAHFRPNDRRTACWLTVDLLFVALLCLPALPHLQSLIRRKGNWAAFVPQESVAQIVTIYPLWFYVGVSLAVALAVYLLRFPQPGSFRVTPTKPSDSGDYELTALIGTWLFVPLTLAWLLTRTDVARVMFRRYLAVTGAAPPLLAVTLGYLTTKGQGRWQWAAVVAVLGLCWIGPVPEYRETHHWISRAHEDWRGATEWLADGMKAEPLPLLLRPGLIEAADWKSLDQPAVWSYCQFPLLGIYKNSAIVSQQITVLPNGIADVPPASDHSLPRAEGYWLLSRSAQSPSPITISALSQLAGAPLTVAEHRVYGHLHVSRLKVVGTLRVP